MNYISLLFYVFLIFVLILYYLFPVKRRWWVLLFANAIFLFGFHRTGWWIILGTSVFSYVMALLLNRVGKDSKKKIILSAGIIGVILPWIIVKNGQLLFPDKSFIVPLGISFYTLQIISYLVDAYKGKILPQKNFLKFFLYVTYFPQIIQGPIPRYDRLGVQLEEEHRFNEESFVKGCYLIIWGFFLKWVIADKADILVDTVFNGQPSYRGVYIWVASILYSIQLYADFKACTTISRGVSRLFGIELDENFNHPYFAVSVRDFWRRWHMSLSSWLKDYIYIPLGGNRKGELRKYINILITFIVSGIWHGAGIKFVFWGLMHAVYQILEMIWERVKVRIGVLNDLKFERIVKILWTFFWVNLAWIIFRADTLKTGLIMIKSMLTDFNIWVMFDNRLYSLGLARKELAILTLAIFFFLFVSYKEEQGLKFIDALYTRSLPVRWVICIVAIFAILVLGTYGYGYNAADFIYSVF